MKMRHASVFFIEKEDIAGKSRAGIRQLMRLLTSADHLHVHPLRMQPRDETEANEFLFFAPRGGVYPKMG
jgi:hypothetical protein